MSHRFPAGQAHGLGVVEVAGSERPLPENEVAGLDAARGHQDSAFIRLPADFVRVAVVRVGVRVKQLGPIYVM
jgi:hypothetical protein